MAFKRARRAAQTWQMHVSVELLSVGGESSEEVLEGVQGAPWWSSGAPWGVQGAPWWSSGAVGGGSISRLTEGSQEGQSTMQRMQMHEAYTGMGTILAFVLRCEEVDDWHLTLD